MHDLTRNLLESMLILPDMPVELRQIPYNDPGRDFEAPARELAGEQYRRAVRALNYRWSGRADG